MPADAIPQPLYDQTVSQLGMMILPYGDRWPELRDILGKIYAERAADIPWLPPGWLARVQALHGTNSMLLLPSTSLNTPPVSFLKTPDQKAWWDDFHTRANNALTAYANNQAAAGWKIVADANADAVFWDRAYNLAVVLAAPVTAARTVFANPFATLALLGAGLFLYLSIFKKK